MKRVASNRTPILGSADEKANVRISFEKKSRSRDQLSRWRPRMKMVHLGTQVASRSRVWASSPSMNWNPGQRVSGLATGISAGLADSKITQADVTELGWLDDEISRVKNAPRAAIAGAQARREPFRI